MVYHRNFQLKIKSMIGTKRKIKSLFDSNSLKIKGEESFWSNSLILIFFFMILNSDYKIFILFLKTSLIIDWL